LKQHSTNNIVLWAPTDASGLGRWMQTFLKLMEQRPALQVHLLLDRPVLPGRIPPTDLLDYWPTPVFTTTARHHIQGIRLLHPPLKVLEAGPLGPRLRERHVGLLTLGPERHDTLPTPLANTWHEACQETEGLEAIVIDFPAEYHAEVRRVLQAHRHEQITVWSRVTPSPADSRDRKTLYGYTTDGCTDLVCLLLVRHLRTLLRGIPHITIGHTGIMRDPGAMIADSLGPGGMLAALDYAEQVIFLSSRKSVLITTTAKHDWETLMTDQATDAEPERLTKLAWRRSTRGGRTWVIPQVLSKNRMTEITDKWAPEVGPARGTVYVQVQGDAGPTVEKLGNELAVRLSAWSCTTWTLLPLDCDPRPGQLAPVTGRAGEWDGAFIIETHDSNSTAALAKFLNHECFSTASGPRRPTVEVRHDYAGTATSSGKGQGKGGRRRC
jgi:hypothetical protein